VIGPGLESRLHYSICVVKYSMLQTFITFAKLVRVCI